MADQISVNDSNSIQHTNKSREAYHKNSKHTDIFSTQSFEPVIAAACYSKAGTKADETDNKSVSSSPMDKRRYAPTTLEVNITKDLKNLQQLHKIKILFQAKVMMNGGALEQQKLASTSPNDETWANPTSYVRMPHNRLNTKSKKTSHSKETVTKWSIIEVEFARLCSLVGRLDPTTIEKEFQSSITKYNSQGTNRSFKLLSHPIISGLLQSMDHPILPIITREAAMIKDRFPFSFPILQRQQNQTIFITQKQASSILANAFFCTFPQRIGGQELPEINFFSLFDGGPAGDSKSKVEKLKCILHYFRRQPFIKDEGYLLSFQRRYLPPSSHPEWNTSKEKMSRLFINHEGRIEDQNDMLQVDFANRSIGGGILGEGMVMEEIRFAICPELIVCRLFTENLGKDEVLFINGVEQFTNYVGYGSTFHRITTDFQDKREIDKFGRRKTEIVAVDAYNFKATDKLKQFEPHLVDRELNKCFCAFKPRRNQHPNPIATGNWGCGAFNGDPELKFIIQWMAASQAKQRELHYFTFGNLQQSNRFLAMRHFLTTKNADVGAIYRAIRRYYAKEIDTVPPFRSSYLKSLFHYFEHQHKW